MSRRYTVGTWRGEAAVIDTVRLAPIGEVIATCGVPENAEKIVAALNEAEGEDEPPEPQEARPVRASVVHV
jgi:hypothetical protein